MPQQPVQTEFGLATHHYWWKEGVFYRHRYGHPENVEFFKGGKWVDLWREYAEAA